MYFFVLRNDNNCDHSYCVNIRLCIIINWTSTEPKDCCVHIQTHSINRHFQFWLLQGKFHCEIQELIDLIEQNWLFSFTDSNCWHISKFIVWNEWATKKYQIPNTAQAIAYIRIVDTNCNHQSDLFHRNFMIRLTNNCSL